MTSITPATLAQQPVHISKDDYAHNQSTAPNFIYDALRNSGVIPDVLPDNINLQGTLEVMYTGSGDGAAQTYRVVMGEEVPRNDTQNPPKIMFAGTKADHNASYTIIMTDPDLTMPNDTTFGQCRHWIQSRIRFNEAGEADLSHSVVQTRYLGCAPGPGPAHRYVFILCKETTTPLTRSSSSQLQTSTMATSSSSGSDPSGGVHEPLKERYKFSAAQYITEHHLEVVGVAFMKVSPNVSSVATNLGLVGESVAQSVGETVVKAVESLAMRAGMERGVGGQASNKGGY